MTTETTLHRHPIRGLLWGLVFGLGVTGLLIVFSVVPLSISNLVSYTVAITVASVLWGLVGPPKKPKGAAPGKHAAPAAAAAPPPAAPMAAENSGDASMDGASMSAEEMDDDGEGTAG